MSVQAAHSSDTEILGRAKYFSSFLYRYSSSHQQRNTACPVCVAENGQGFVVSVYSMKNPAWTCRYNVAHFSGVSSSNFFSCSHCGIILETPFCLLMGI